jgi:hypothetical protein
MTPGREGAEWGLPPVVEARTSSVVAALVVFLVASLGYATWIRIRRREDALIGWLITLGGVAVLRGVLPGHRRRRHAYVRRSAPRHDRGPTAADRHPPDVGGGSGLPDDQARFASPEHGSALLAARKCDHTMDYLQAGMMVTHRGRGRRRGAQRDALRRNQCDDIAWGNR